MLKTTNLSVDFHYREFQESDGEISWCLSRDLPLGLGIHTLTTLLDKPLIVMYLPIIVVKEKGNRSKKREFFFVCVGVLVKKR